jgi:hypothetical protein
MKLVFYAQCSFPMGFATFEILKKISYLCMGGPLMVAQWLRYCAANRKVAGSIPDGVTGIFH